MTRCGKWRFCPAARPCGSVKVNIYGAFLNLGGLRTALRWCRLHHTNHLPWNWPPNVQNWYSTPSARRMTFQRFPFYHHFGGVVTVNRWWNLWCMRKQWHQWQAARLDVLVEGGSIICICCLDGSVSPMLLFLAGRLCSLDCYNHWASMHLRPKIKVVFLSK